MEVMDRLIELKELEDKNRAIDNAFVSGVQSVSPMREFVCSELELLLDAVRELASKTAYSDCTRERKRLLDEIATRISTEIVRRKSNRTNATRGSA